MGKRVEGRPALSGAKAECGGARNALPLGQERRGKTGSEPGAEGGKPSNLQGSRPNACRPGMDSPDALLSPGHAEFGEVVARGLTR
jgi:hypothetical protein